MSAGDDKLRDRFRQLLLDAPTRDPAVGWQLALDLGRPAVPLLWEMLKAERSDVGKRLRLLVAAVLAGGAHEDERLFEWLAAQKPMLEERTLTALLLALGPARARPMPNYWSRLLGGGKETQQVLSIAARLAAVRFPDSEVGAPPVTDDDPGIVAATAFARLPVPAQMDARWWNLRAVERHAELVWRGGMLGAARKPSGNDGALDVWLARAGEVMSLSDATAPARSAAVWLRAAAHDFRADTPLRDVELLQVASGDLRTATTLEKWLGPLPQPRDDQPQRLAEPRVARHVAIALAWALAGTAAPTPIDVSVPELAEWDFVRAASGARADGGGSVADPQLQATLELCRQGRLPRGALRSHLEEAMWRAGSHPRLAPFELERALVRDLLLSGSNPGNKYQMHLRLHQRYSPSGMDRNDAFFALAVPVFDFLAKPRSPMPAEHRLPEN